MRCKGLLQAPNKKVKNVGVDNSIFKVIITMPLLSGDPCFKIPSSAGDDGQSEVGAAGTSNGESVLGSSEWNGTLKVRTCQRLQAELTAIQMRGGALRVEGWVAGANGSTLALNADVRVPGCSIETSRTTQKVADLETSLVRLASLAELTQRTSSDPRVREWCSTRISANTIVDQVLSTQTSVAILRRLRILNTSSGGEDGATPHQHPLEAAPVCFLYLRGC